MIERTPHRDIERDIQACEYNIDYWLDREDLEAAEAYALMRKQFREQAGYEPDEVDRLFDE